jgi:hypothetical protein
VWLSQKGKSELTRDQLPISVQLAFAKQGEKERGDVPWESANRTSLTMSALVKPFLDTLFLFT